MSFGVAMRNSVSLGLGGIPSLASGSRGNNPTLNLNFAATKTLDPRITFTRASTATYYDGVTTAKAEENLLLQSQDFTTTWANTATTDTANTAVAPDGTTTADTLTETAVTNIHNIYQFFTPTNGLPYAFSVFVKKGTGLGARDFVQIGFQNAGFGVNSYANFDINSGTVTFTGAGLTSASIVSAGNNWYRCIIVDTAVASSATAAFISLITTDTAANQESYLGVVTADMFLWGAQLEQRSTVTAYTPTTTEPITNYIPVLLTAAAGVARFDHNPITSESLGLEIEEQRSNLVTYSEQFDNAAWAKTAVTITANTIVSPDGTLNGDKLVETAIGSEHFFNQAATYVSGTAYTFSVYAKKGERNFVVLTFGTAAFGAATRAWFDLASGTVGTLVNGPTATITPVGNGWYRCTIIKTATASTAANTIVGVSNADNVLTYTGNGFNGIYIWGAQLEAGAFATSYIPTVASQVTRSADAASMTGTNFSSWYNPSEGTMYVDYVRNGLTGNASPFSIDDGTLGNSIRFIFGGVTPANQRFDVNSSGVSQASFILTTTGVVGTPYKAAAAYKLNNVAAVENNTGIQTDSVAVIPTVTRAVLGASISAQINGTIKQISYYPQRLPNSQLQALTT